MNAQLQIYEAFMYITVVFQSIALIACMCLSLVFTGDASTDNTQTQLCISHAHISLPMLLTVLLVLSVKTGFVHPTPSLQCCSMVLEILKLRKSTNEGVSLEPLRGGEKHNLQKTLKIYAHFLYFKLIKES
jgi:hypothetical protein